jgi:hypothetical protein
VSATYARRASAPKVAANQRQRFFVFGFFDGDGGNSPAGAIRARMPYTTQRIAW